MTTKGLIEAIAKETGLKPNEAQIVLKAIISSIQEGLERGETVELRGLGTLEARDRKSKPARIIKTGEQIRVPARRVPCFKPGKVLKKIVNENV